MEFDTEALREFVDAQIAARGLVAEDLGIDWDKLLGALAHPLAAEAVAESMAREPDSAQVGQDAPDFTLRRLGDSDGEPVCLGSHFGRRPVALVLGSYT
ncbi:MAG: hypothetical protein VCA74_04035 [Deltaproteobacteria bacterium]